MIRTALGLSFSGAMWVAIDSIGRVLWFLSVGFLMHEDNYWLSNGDIDNCWIVLRWGRDWAVLLTMVTMLVVVETIYMTMLSELVMAERIWHVIGCDWSGGTILASAFSTRHTVMCATKVSPRPLSHDSWCNRTFAYYAANGWYSLGCVTWVRNWVPLTIVHCFTTLIRHFCVLPTIGTAINSGCSNTFKRYNSVAFGANWIQWLYYGVALLCALLFSDKWLIAGVWKDADQSEILLRQWSVGLFETQS